MHNIQYYRGRKCLSTNNRQPPTHATTHSPFVAGAELAITSPAPCSTGSGTCSCTAGLSDPAAAALRFVSRLGERGPRCRLDAACLIGDGHRLRLSPGRGESLFSSVTGPRLRAGLSTAIGGHEAAGSHDSWLRHETDTTRVFLLARRAECTANCAYSIRTLCISRTFPRSWVLFYGMTS